MISQKDRNGNIVEISDYGDVTVCLKNGSKRGNIKRIGSVTKLDDKLRYSKVINNRHIFNADDSIGINYAVIQMLPAGSEISVTQRETWIRYVLSKEEVINKGTVRSFNKKGYEVQYFVPRGEWRQSKQGVDTL